MRTAIFLLCLGLTTHPDTHDVFGWIGVGLLIGMWIEPFVQLADGKPR